MSAFSAVQARRPPAFVVVPVSAFKDDWVDRPREPVAVGLRMVGNKRLEVARAQARKVANAAIKGVDTEDPDDMQLWADAFHHELFLQIVTYGTCDPNDVMADWPLFEVAPEDMAREYLSPDGLKFLFDAWERMRISVDPTQREATDEEVERLPELLRERGAGMGRVEAMRARRLIAFVIDRLQAAPAPRTASEATSATLPGAEALSRSPAPA